MFSLADCLVSGCNNNIIHLHMGQEQIKLLLKYKSTNWRVAVMHEVQAKQF